MGIRLVDIKGLEYFAKKMKEYIDIKTELTYNTMHNRPTNCPNCSAPITGTKCEYCDTDFGVFIKDI